MTLHIEADTPILRNFGRHNEPRERPWQVTEMPVDSGVPRHRQIRLPGYVREELTVEQGDLVEIEVTNDRAVLMRQKSVDKRQAYFWTRKWQEAEREPDQDIKAGSVKAFDSQKTQ